MTATVRMRDDFNFRALGEASIAGQALGIDHKTVNWQTVLTLARAERDRGVPVDQIDWRKIVTQAAGRLVEPSQVDRPPDTPGRIGCEANVSGNSGSVE